MAITAKKISDYPTGLSEEASFTDVDFGSNSLKEISVKNPTTDSYETIRSPNSKDSYGLWEMKITSAFACANGTQKIIFDTLVQDTCAIELITVFTADDTPDYTAIQNSSPQDIYVQIYGHVAWESEASAVGSRLIQIKSTGTGDKVYLTSKDYPINSDGLIQKVSGLFRIPANDTAYLESVQSQGATTDITEARLYVVADQVVQT